MPLEPGILTTKLYRPGLTGDLVSRPRLLERLEDRRDRPLTLVSAPAGYGKTTLVSSWLETCKCPNAWVSLDAGDDDLILFLTYFLAAVETMFPDALAETRPLLSGVSLPPLPVLIRSLVNELDQVEHPFILVLDDFHHISTIAVHDLLNGLLIHPPRSMHLVLISRIDPPLSLGRLRGRRQVTEVRTNELRFTGEETAAFVEQEIGTPIDDSIVSALQQRVEGWITGLRLVTLSFRQQGSVDLSLTGPSGSVSYVAEYLVEEVLQSQPQTVQDYLLNTAILDRFCAPLCAAVQFGLIESPEADQRGMSGQAFVEWLKENDPFLVRLDDQGGWYRYHHLFRELLLIRLEQRRGPSAMAQLHRQASAWFAQNRLISEALDHALLGGDADAAARLVAEHRHEAMNEERWHRLRRWLGLLPRDLVENDPQLLIIEAWLLIGWSKMADVAERVGTLLAKLPADSADIRYLQAEFDTLQSLISYHATDGEKSLALAQRALETIPREFSSERGLAVMLKSMAYQMLGDLESARSVVWEALTERATLHPTYRARVLMTTCFVDSIAADLNGVLQSAERVLRYGQQLSLAETIAHGYYFLGLGHYERNELTAAEKYLLPVVKGAYIANLHNFSFSSFLLALTYQAQGRPSEAREVVDAVVDRAMEMGDVSLLQTTQTFQADLAIRRGEVAAAHHWAASFSPDPFYVAYRFYVPQITLPKYLLALNTSDSRRQAVDLLSRLHDFFASIHNNRLLIEVLALQALLHGARNDEPAALSALERAITLAEPGGFIRVFVDLGPRVVDLLARLRQRGVAPEYVARILAAFPTTAKTEAFTAIPSSVVSRPSFELVEPLTDREIDVLALLAQRLTNKEIAAQLFISPGTVAQHTHQIYQKLDVHNRRQAVAKAKALSILPPS